MTFLRHFPSKDRVLLGDPYDAPLVAAVAALTSALRAVGLARMFDVVAAVDGRDLERTQ